APTGAPVARRASAPRRTASRSGSARRAPRGLGRPSPPEASSTGPDRCRPRSLSRQGRARTTGSRPPPHRDGRRPCTRRRARDGIGREPHRGVVYGGINCSAKLRGPLHGARGAVVVTEGVQQCRAVDETFERPEVVPIEVVEGAEVFGRDAGRQEAGEGGIL